MNEGQCTKKPMNKLAGIDQRLNKQMNALVIRKMVGRMIRRKKKRVNGEYEQLFGRTGG